MDGTSVKSGNSELEDNFELDNKNDRNYFIPGTSGKGKGTSDLPSSSIIEFRDQSIRRTERKITEEKDTLVVENSEAPMTAGAAKSNISSKPSANSKDAPQIGEQYRDAWAENGGEKGPTQEFESQELKEMSYTRTILNYSKYMNGILTFILVAEMCQYLLPNEKVFLYFMSPTFIRVVMYCHMAALYINFVAFIYNFIFNVCANSGGVQRNKLKHYMTIMIWCFGIFILRILWEIQIQDYRWLVNMNSHNFQK